MAISLGWFSSGRDLEAIRLLEQVQSAIESNFIKANIDFVFCNREKGESAQSDAFINAVKKSRIDLICFSSKKFKPSTKGNPRSQDQWRREYDEVITNLIRRQKIDLIILAGYMLIVSDVLCKHFRMINLHPALPKGPKGTWQEVIWNIIEERKSETGAMMHLVTEKLDEGPPISYFTFPIRGGEFDNLWLKFEQKTKGKSFNEIRLNKAENEELFNKIREEEFKREIPLIISTLSKISKREIDIRSNGQILINGEESKSPLCLNDEVYRLQEGGF
jgi:phosphoribosylglycinamide formyltransferase-1